MPSMTPTPQGTLIVLSGTSSAGKTSLALSLQAEMPQPYFRLSSDDQFALLHPRFLRPGTADREAVRFPMVRAYYRTLAAVASSGSNVIADTILIPDWPDVPTMRQVNIECLSYLLAETGHVYFIGVLCSLEELERREQKRGDRGTGSARAQYDSVHAHGCYDLTVDTSLHSADECAREVARFISQCERPNGLHRLHRQLQDD